MRLESTAWLALVLTFVEAVFAGATSAPLASLIGPFTDSELLAAGSPYVVEALRLARPGLVKATPPSLCWFAVGLLATLVARGYVYRRTAHLSRWHRERQPTAAPFLFLSLGGILVKFALLATFGLIVALTFGRTEHVLPFALGTAALLFGLHACVAAWLDASRALVSVGVPTLRALAQGTQVATSARLVLRRAGLGLLHLGALPLGYLAVAVTEGGLLGVLALAAVQALLFGLGFAEVLWIRALGAPLGLTGSPARTRPAAQTELSPSGA